MDKTADVFIFPKGNISPDAILYKAREWRLKSVLIIGFDENDNFVIGGSNDNYKDIIWALHLARRFVDKNAL